MSTPRSAWTGAAASGLVGLLATAIAGAAMWRSPAPWTFTLDTGSVFLGQTVPAFRAWFAGDVPEWSDLLWGGFPLVGDCTSAVLYPLHAVAYLLARDAPLRFFDVAFALHLGIFTAGSAALVRRLGGSTGAAVLAGSLAAVTPIAHFSAIAYFPVFGAHAWWPWTFLAVEALARPATPLFGGAMALGWLALAAQVLVGVPEQATYCAVAAACWLLVRPTPLGLGRRAVRLLVLALGATALAAPQLVPTMALLPWTHRAGTPPEFEFGSLWLTRPERLFVPGVGALNGLPSFLGVATSILAIVAAVARRPRATFLFVTGVVAFALALGPQVGLYGLLHQLPLFDRFRNPGKVYALAEYCAVWLAALGADALWRRPGRAARAAAAVLVAAALAEHAAYVPTEIAALGERRAGDGLLPERYARLAALTPLHRRGPTTPPPVVFDAGGPVGGGYARSVGALLGISSLHAGSVALLSPAHFQLLSPPSPLVLERLGTAFLLAPRDKCERLARRYAWTTVESGPEDCVFANPRVPERHVVLDDVVALASREEMLAAMTTAGPMPIVAAPGAFDRVRGGLVSLVSYAPGRAVLRSVTPGPALVLVRDSLAPGWTVRVDGHEVTPVPAAGIFFAVPVGAGVHEIALRYRAPGLRLGLAAFVAWTALALVASLAARRSRA
jgi:hypothetical protein